MLRRRHGDLQNSANHAPIQIPIFLELLVHFGGNLDEGETRVRQLYNEDVRGHTC